MEDRIEEFSKGYINFMNGFRSTRKVIEYFENLLKKDGFVDLESYDGKVPAKVYMTFKGKSLIALKLNSKLKDGLTLVVSHVDSPRLDLKPKPFLEDEKLVFLKTHYYGGVKKYHWLSIPLAIVGTVFKENGEKIEIEIGLKDEDPVFTITDLLPHLDKEDKKVSEKFKGENLRVLFASVPLEGEEKDAVLKNVEKLLKERYDLSLEDFVSADIEIVPAIDTREVGIEGSMIGSYAHDDRVCAYTSVMALLDADSDGNFGVILFDREEIGSEGETSAKSEFYVHALKKMLKLQGSEDVGYDIGELFLKTKVISADVNAAFDPLYKDVFDKENTAFLGGGVVLTKYTGRGGKYSASEASAEFVAKVRKILNEEKVKWQVGTLGKVDVGGGGTVAKFLANRGAEVLDMGVAVLGMHSPFEVISKFDLFETYRGFKALMEKLR